MYEFLVRNCDNDDNDKVINNGGNFKTAMSEEMVKDGYTEILNVDSSATCIEQMNAKYKGNKEFSAMVCESLDFIYHFSHILGTSCMCVCVYIKSVFNINMEVFILNHDSFKCYST